MPVKEMFSRSFPLDDGGHVDIFLDTPTEKDQYAAFKESDHPRDDGDKFSDTEIKGMDLEGWDELPERKESLEGQGSLFGGDVDVHEVRDPKAFIRGCKDFSREQKKEVTRISNMRYWKGQVEWLVLTGPKGSRTLVGRKGKEKFMPVILPNGDTFDAHWPKDDDWSGYAGPPQTLSEYRQNPTSGKDATTAQKEEEPEKPMDLPGTQKSLFQRMTEVLRYGGVYQKDTDGQQGQ